MPFVWKATFIDEILPEAALLRRSRSEPPQKTSNTVCEIFDSERDYVSTLEASACQLKPVKEQKLVHRRAVSGSSVSTALPTSDLNRVARLDEVSCSSGGTDLSLHQSNGDVLLSLCSHLPIPASHKPLESTIQRIEAIPEQMAEEMQKENLAIVGEVQNQIAKMCQAVMKSHSATEHSKWKAVEKLAQIPQLLMVSLEDALTQAKVTLSDRIEELASPTRHGNTKYDALMQQLQSLPSEASELVLQTTTASLHQSSIEVAQCVDMARALVPECKALVDGSAHMVSIIASGPPATAIHSVEKMTALQMELAGADITGIKRSSARSENLAESVMRNAARTSEAPPSLGAASDACSPLRGTMVFSKGSLGHPGLCKQPCIHFMRGGCSLGADCGFCHMPHRSRGAHLDKRNRELLKSLPFNRRAALALSKIQRQVSRLGVTAQAQELLWALEAAASRAPPAQSAHGSRGAASSLSGLSSALSALSLRALMTAICKGEDTPEWFKLRAIDF